MYGSAWALGWVMAILVAFGLAIVSSPLAAADSPTPLASPQQDTGKKDDKKDTEKKEDGKKDEKAKDDKKGKGGKGDSDKPAASKAKSALEFVVKDIDGKDYDLKQHAGHVILIVNTASKCGYTPQYIDLEQLYEKYKSKQFVIIGFPSNDFKEQEPGTNEEIKKFCTNQQGVTFPMMAKVHVKGDEAIPLYKYLTAGDHPFPGEVPWNFTKFLIDRNGHVVARFKPSDHPLKSKAMTAAIEKALSEAAAPTEKKDEPEESRPRTRMRGR